MIRGMRFAGAIFLSCLLLSVLGANPQTTPEDMIQHVLVQQVAAWNRGDLTQFVSSYATHCTLVGSSISATTREQVLAHYEQKYPSPGARGTLSFSGTILHPLDARVATVTGHWHVDRAAAYGGSIGGVFSLVFESIDGSWLIVLDHTS